MMMRRIVVGAGRRQVGIWRRVSSTTPTVAGERASGMIVGTDDMDLSVKKESNLVSRLNSGLGVASDLSKAKLSAFVAMTTFAGYAATGAPLLESGGSIDTGAMLATGGVFCCSATANALNQVYESDRDAVMERTKRRPLPSGKCTKETALSLALGSGCIGVGALALTGSTTAALLGAGNIVLYAGIYTPMKQHSEFNTWVGAVVGAIPPLIGWAAAGEPLLHSADPWLLATLLYLWQFPHFFALAWRHKQDYTRGGYQMVAVNDPTGIRTARLISRYALYATALPAVAIALGSQGSMFSLHGLALNALLLTAANRFHSDRSKANATRVFRVTLFYLPILLLAFFLHSKRLNDEAHDAQDTQHWTLRDALEPIRQLGRDICVHEIFFLQRRDTPQPSFCPVHLGTITRTQVEDKGAKFSYVDRHTTDNTSTSSSSSTLSTPPESAPFTSTPAATTTNTNSKKGDSY